MKSDFKQLSHGLTDGIVLQYSNIKAALLHIRRYSKVYHQISRNVQGAYAYRCNKLVNVWFVRLYGR